MIFSLLQKLFLTVLEISIASSAVILPLLLISMISGNRYSPKTRHFVWLAISVRMLIPFNMPFDHALTLNIFASPAANISEIGTFIPNPSELFIGDAAGDTNTATTAAAAGKRLASLTALQLATMIWAAGAAAFLLYHIGAYLYTLHKLRRWSVPVKGEAARVTLLRMKRELGVKSDIALYESAKAESPLLLGYFRPKIILPVEALSTRQLELMLCHELCHFKRRDLWFKLIMLLSTSVHWFNPLCYLMERQARADTELACDARVLQNADHDTRKAYGMAVLLFLEHGWRCKTPLTTYFYGGKRQMKQRFKDIADGSAKKSGYAILFTALLAVVFAGCAISVPAKENRQSAVVQAPRLTAAGQEDPQITPVQTASQIADEPEAPDYVGYGDFKEGDWEDVNAQIEWSKLPYAGGVMAWPLPGYHTITSGFGPRYGGTDNHTGICISGEAVNGAAIVAANEGTVARVMSNDTVGVGYGKYVILDHGGGMTTLYANCSNIIVGEGDKVIKGQKIAEVGSTGFSTGPHLHFEVRKENVPEDPMPYVTSPGFIRPVAGGYISAGVGAYPGHTGMDIAGGTGTPIYAAADGVVTKAVESYVGYGKHLMIDHGNGYSTLYAMNNKLLVGVGDTVKQGQTIAEMGRTGNATGVHLHFEVRFNGRIMDPEDFIEDDEEVDYTEPQ